MRWSVKWMHNGYVYVRDVNTRLEIITLIGNLPVDADLISVTKN